MKTSVSRTLVVALSSASCAAFVLAGTAHADRRAAPIVYPGASEALQTDTTEPSVAAAPTALTEDRRIAFQYPTEGAPTMREAPAKIFLPVPPQPPTTTLVAPAIAAPVQSTFAKPPSQPIRIAAVDSQQIARTGKPLTLSRIRANRDAKISEERGRAGVYTDGFNGQPTANGEIFDETAMTAAHPSLPLPSLVQVINEENSREVVVRVNDRGPFDGKRVLELSPRAGDVLGISQGGAASVRVRYLGPAPVQQNPETFASSNVEDESLPPVATTSMRQSSTLEGSPFGSVVKQAAPMPAPVPTYTAPVRVASMSVTAPAAAGNVFIQAGAFSDIANAQHLTASLGGNIPVKIEEARVNGGDYFRVLIGPFPSMDMAERERSALSRSGVVDGFLTKR